MKNIKPRINFLKKGLIFIIALWIGDLILGSLLDFFYFNQKSGVYYETTYSIFNTREDVLIFGASTANRHYDPEIFENELKMSCYNTGRDGQGILYFLAVQEAVLKRYTPKIIILELYFNALNNEHDDYDRLNALLPYYNKSEEIKSILDLRKAHDNIKTISHIYPYSSMIATILSNQTSNNKSEKGYAPLTKNVKHLEQEAYSTKDFELDIVKVAALERFINNCKKHNIDLFIVRSPYYSNGFFKTKSLQKIEEIVANEKIKIINFSNPDTIIYNSKLKIADVMSNATHLNKTGAEIYSKMVCTEIIKDSSKLTFIN